jgi:hypothetical protein
MVPDLLENKKRNDYHHQILLSGPGDVFGEGCRYLLRFTPISGLFWRTMPEGWLISPEYYGWW